MKKIVDLDTNQYPIERSQIVFIRRKPDINLRQVDLSDTVEYVGASIKGQDTLRGLDFDEEKVYLKNIIGVNPGSDKWEFATKDYWSNIRVPIPLGDGRQLEIGFKYANEKDAAVADAGDFSIKQSLGVPIEVSDYVFYRYCLKYKRVALKIDDIYKSTNISFYIYNKIDDVMDKKKASDLRTQAFMKRMSILSDRDLVNDVLILFGEAPEKMTNDEKDLKLDELSLSNPAKFVARLSDENLKSKAFVERCITKGILKRLPNTDTVVYGDNTILGANIEETIMTLYRNTPSSTTMLNTLKARLNETKEVTPIKPIEIVIDNKPVLDSDLPIDDNSGLVVKKTEATNPPTVKSEPLNFAR